MDIRKITTIEERVWSSLCSGLAFGARRSMEDTRKAVAESTPSGDDWGCFTDDGKLMAHVQNERRHTMFDGHEAYTGCIGAVSTFPEYRAGGAVRQIFACIFPDALKAGEVFSYLFPFNHEFYRKFGYETCCDIPAYRFPVSALSAFRFKGWSRLWLPGDDVTEHAAIYDAFSRNYNITHVRSVEAMKGRIHSDPFESRRYTYLLGYDEPCAYITFAYRSENDRKTIEVLDCAWRESEGFRAVLGFLGRYSADYSDILFRMPTNLKLGYIIPDGYALDATKLANGYMVRVINVKKALEMLRKPAGACFTIEVNDPLIPANSGTWRVEGESAMLCEAEADISVSVTALGPMLLGYTDLTMAEYREDVKVYSSRELLEKIFIEKPGYIAPADHF